MDARHHKRPTRVQREHPAKRRAKQILGCLHRWWAALNVRVDVLAPPRRAERYNLQAPTGDAASASQQDLLPIEGRNPGDLAGFRLENEDVVRGRERVASDVLLNLAEPDLLLVAGRAAKAEEGVSVGPLVGVTNGQALHFAYGVRRRARISRARSAAGPSSRVTELTRGRRLPPVRRDVTHQRIRRHVGSTASRRRSLVPRCPETGSSTGLRTGSITLIEATLSHPSAPTCRLLSCWPHPPRQSERAWFERDRMLACGMGGAGFEPA